MPSGTFYALALGGAFWHGVGMDKHQQFISEVRRYCQERDITPESLCRRATGNPRKWQRLLGKLDAIETDMERIRDAMKEDAA